ncbi:MAG: HEAT repeat domain-containing protein [Planctomycetota bacterium]|jgi:HEAT repeat protein
MRVLPLIFLSLLLAAQEKQEDRVADLVERLRTGTIEERAEAFHALVRMRDSAVPGLMGCLTDPDAFVRTRVRDAIVKIDAPGPIINAMLGDEAAIAWAAADIFHAMHERPVPTYWRDVLGRKLETKSAVPVRFSEFRNDLLMSGVPLLVWPPDTEVQHPDRTYEGTCAEILEKVCRERGWKRHFSEGGIVVYPEAREAEARRKVLCQVMVEQLAAEEAFSSLSILLADLSWGSLEKVLVKRATSADGFWRHSVDILTYQLLKRWVDAKLGDETTGLIAGRLKHPHWRVRAGAAQALAKNGILPEGALEDDDPYVRYLAAWICWKTGIRDPHLKVLMRDRHRDIRSRALFAELKWASVDPFNCDAVLHAVETVDPADRDKALETVRSLTHRKFGPAAVKLLATDSRDLAFDLLRVFVTEEVIVEVCKAARLEENRPYLERYFDLLSYYYDDFNNGGMGGAEPVVRETLFWYAGLPSARLAAEAIDVLIGEKEPEVLEQFKSLLTDKRPLVRFRAVEALHQWAMVKYYERGEENDRLAQVLEGMAAGEALPDIAETARRYAARLRLRAAVPTRVGGGGRGGRYGSHLRGKRDLVARGGGGGVIEIWRWTPLVKITIPRPDFAADEE